MNVVILVPTTAWLLWLLSLTPNGPNAPEPFPGTTITVHVGTPHQGPISRPVVNRHRGR